VRMASGISVLRRVGRLLARDVERDGAATLFKPARAQAAADGVPQSVRAALLGAGDELCAGSDCHWAGPVLQPALPESRSEFFRRRSGQGLVDSTVRLGTGLLLLGMGGRPFRTGPGAAGQAIFPAGGVLRADRGCAVVELAGGRIAAVLLVDVHHGRLSDGCVAHGRAGVSAGE